MIILPQYAIAMSIDKLSMRVLSVGIDNGCTVIDHRHIREIFFFGSISFSGKNYC